MGFLVLALFWRWEGEKRLMNKAWNVKMLFTPHAPLLVSARMQQSICVSSCLTALSLNFFLPVYQMPDELSFLLLVFISFQPVFKAEIDTFPTFPPLLSVSQPPEYISAQNFLLKHRQVRAKHFFMLQHCAYALVRFMHKKHSGRAEGGERHDLA